MSWDGRQSVFDAMGNALSSKKAADNTELVWAIIEQAMQYSNESSADIPATKSLFDFFEEKVDEMLTSTLGSSEDIWKKREMILNLAEWWGAFVIRLRALESNHRCRPTSASC